MSVSKYNGQWVIVFGTVSLQRYIFQSNRLKENIGASHLAKGCLEEDLIEAIQQAGCEIGTSAWNKYEKYRWEEDENCTSVFQLEIDPVDLTKPVNIIYIGGGNAALLCQNEETASEVVKMWSRKLLENAPGIRVAVGYKTVKCSLAEAYREALKHMANCEESLPFGAALYALPIVRPCTSTSLPASKQDNREWISQSAASKRAEVGTKADPGRAQNALIDEFGSVLKADRKRNLPRQDFAIELEDLGGHEGESHIAVVHADGNGMGKRLIDIAKNNIDNDHKFLDQLRAFSASVTQLSRNALKATFEHLRAALPIEALHTSRYIFPLRPIVYGGDDLTFVCDGRLGLGLASYYLQEFSKRKIKVCNDGELVDTYVDACAGVAIVPTKFPFARAYGLADDLCREAKDQRQKKGEGGSWLDFQILQEGATKTIAALRDTQYRNLEGETLHQRPYQLPEKWNEFVTILNEFQLNWPRSRAKGLLQAITQGPAATESVIDSAQWRKVKMPSAHISERNWFDALEALDFYVEMVAKKEDK